MGVGEAPPGRLTGRWAVGLRRPRAAASTDRCGGQLAGRRRQRAGALLAQVLVTASSLAAGASKTVAKSILEGSPL